MIPSTSETEAIGEELLRALFVVDEEKVDRICNDFLKKLGLREIIQCKFTPKQLRWDRWIEVEIETIFNGEEYSFKWNTDYYYPHRVDSVKFYLILNDVLLGVETFLRKLFRESVWEDVAKRDLFGDEFFKITMAKI